MFDNLDLFYIHQREQTGQKPKDRLVHGAESLYGRKRH